MYIKYFFILPVVILFSACSVLPVFRADPLEKEKYFDYGREVVSQENNKFKVLLNFETQSGSDLIFYLSVYNKSDEPVFFNPSLIYAEIIKAIEPEHAGRKIFAVNPEDEIVQIDKTINQTNAGESFNSGIFLLASFANLAESIADIGKNKTDKQIEEENRNREDLESAIENDKYAYEKKMNSLNQQKDYWENDALRKTTLKEHEEITGFFHLKINENILLFNLIITVGEDSLLFHFKLLQI